jgi:hypothetical protein
MHQSNDKLHPVAISQVMLNFAQRNGIDRQTCLLGTGILESELSSGEGLVTRTQEMRLIENLMLALPEVGASGFGVLLCAPVRPCAKLLHLGCAICL